ncbi:hypothetical protein TWF718_005865 [Orbilia javanica]|uniref:Uncharacterized protein n=1 Tax=Orbilia javanica TaxID=47235 RepID=A0AAN8N8D3_9PEZI
MARKSIPALILAHILPRNWKPNPKSTKSSGLKKNSSQRFFGKSRKGKESVQNPALVESTRAPSTRGWVVVETTKRQKEDEDEFLYYRRMKKCGKHRLEDRIERAAPLQSKLCDPTCNNIIKIFYRGFGCEECGVFPKLENAGSAKLRVREYGSTAVMLRRASVKSGFSSALSGSGSRIELSSRGDSNDDVKDGLEDIRSQFWKDRRERVLMVFKKG